MKIVGAISWFNETPTWLVRSITSLAKICDVIVAVDGRYAAFQHDMDWSPAPEAEAVLAAAEGAGVPLTLHVPRAPFQGNEVEKRNLVLSLAKVHTEPMEDWILVMDADEYVVHSAVDLRDQLERVEEHVVTWALEEYFDAYEDLAPDGGVALHHPLPATWRVAIRGMYRSLPELTYMGNHHTIGGYDPDAEKWIWLWSHPDSVPAHDLRDFLIIRHENPRRTALRREQAADYYRIRDELKLETDPK